MNTRATLSQQLAASKSKGSGKIGEPTPTPPRNKKAKTNGKNGSNSSSLASSGSESISATATPRRVSSRTLAQQKRKQQQQASSSSQSKGGGSESKKRHKSSSTVTSSTSTSTVGSENVNPIDTGLELEQEVLGFVTGLQALSRHVSAPSLTTTHLRSRFTHHSPTLSYSISAPFPIPPRLSSSSSDEQNHSNELGPLGLQVFDKIGNTATNLMRIRAKHDLSFQGGVACDEDAGMLFVLGDVGLLKIGTGQKNSLKGYIYAHSKPGFIQQPSPVNKPDDRGNDHGVPKYAYPLPLKPRQGTLLFTGDIYIYLHIIKNRSILAISYLCII